MIYLYESRLFSTHSYKEGTAKKLTNKQLNLRNDIAIKVIENVKNILEKIHKQSNNKDMTNAELTKDHVNKLQNVLNICTDGYKGYSAAAENLENTELKTIFNRLSQQRKLFVEEIKEDARKLGHNLDSEGTAAGFFHRNWIGVKDAFSGTDNKAVIDASLTGEQKAMEVFEEAISPQLPSFVNERLKNQLNLVKGAVRQLNEMETQAH